MLKCKQKKCNDKIKRPPLQAAPVSKYWICVLQYKKRANEINHWLLEGNYENTLDSIQ